MSDLKREISEAWGVLSAEGVALRGLFVIDKEGIVQHGERGGRPGDHGEGSLTLDLDGAHG